MGKCRGPRGRFAGSTTFQRSVRAEKYCATTGRGAGTFPCVLYKLRQRGCGGFGGLVSGARKLAKGKTDFFNYVGLVFHGREAFCTAGHHAKFCMMSLKAATPSIEQLSRPCRELSMQDPLLKPRLFDAVVRPSLLYGVGIWVQNRLGANSAPRGYYDEFLPGIIDSGYVLFNGDHGRAWLLPTGDHCKAAASRALEPPGRHG